jgi:hypothetical protein
VQSLRGLYIWRGDFVDRPRTLLNNTACMGIGPMWRQIAKYTFGYYNITLAIERSILNWMDNKKNPHLIIGCLLRGESKIYVQEGLVTKL